jgi:hypothetical protein
MALKSAFEIALERQARREELGKIVDEILEHVALLEECWDSIPTSGGRGTPEQGLRAAA